MLFGVLTLGGNAKDTEHQVCWYKYSDYQFIYQSVNDVILEKLMQILEINTGLPILGIPVLKYLEWTESLIPSHASNDQFPIRRFSARVCSDMHCHERKLVAHGMTFHLSGFEYVREFLGLDRYHGSSGGRKGEVCIGISGQRGISRTFK